MASCILKRNRTCTIEQILIMQNIISIDQVKQLGQNLHNDNKKVVLVGGCFDLLHEGHIELLEKARQQGDVLIVLLESDLSIQLLKGRSRPLHTQAQRAHMLSSLRSVDYVILLPEKMTNQDYDTVVKQLQPAIIATTKGSDATEHIERQAKDNGAIVYFAPMLQGLSTSRILEVIAKEL